MMDECLDCGVFLPQGYAGESRLYFVKLLKDTSQSLPYIKEVAIADVVVVEEYIVIEKYGIRMSAHRDFHLNLQRHFMRVNRGRSTKHHRRR